MSCSVMGMGHLSKTNPVLSWPHCQKVVRPPSPSLSPHPGHVHFILEDLGLVQELKTGLEISDMEVEFVQERMDPIHKVPSIGLFRGQVLSPCCPCLWPRAPPSLSLVLPPPCCPCTTSLSSSATTGCRQHPFPWAITNFGYNLPATNQSPDIHSPQSDVVHQRSHNCIVGSNLRGPSTKDGI